ncbi:hypothetical protein Ancab_017062 [Ancistrocladus abbreviatus]
MQYVLLLYREASSVLFSLNDVGISGFHLSSAYSFPATCHCFNSASFVSLEGGDVEGEHFLLCNRAVSVFSYRVDLIVECRIACLPRCCFSCNLSLK